MSISRLRTSVSLRAAAVLAWGAALIHIGLIPEHFEERTIYGAFFLLASAFQLALGWLLLRKPSARVLGAGALGSLLLLSTWVVTRAVAPPLYPEGRPEPVTLLGVLATGAELAILLILSSYLPIPSQKARWRRRTWSAIAATAFAALVLLASGALSYVPMTAGAPSLQVFADDFSMSSPIVFGLVVPHLWLVGPWSTLVLAVIASVLVSANVSTLILRRSADECRPRPQTAAALATPLFAVSSCCGTPAALFLGASSVSFLFRLTPWLLLATTAMLAVNLVLRGRDPARGPGISSIAGADSGGAGPSCVALTPFPPSSIVFRNTRLLAIHEAALPSLLITSQGANREQNSEQQR